MSHKTLIESSLRECPAFLAMQDTYTTVWYTGICASRVFFVAILLSLQHDYKWTSDSSETHR